MVLSERIYNSLHVDGETRAIALDILEVWHAGLLHKLKAHDIRGYILPIIECFLQDRAIKVVFDGQSSTPPGINAGVLQGSVMGPTLFLVLMTCLMVPFQ